MNPAVSVAKGTHELVDDIAKRQQIREIELELIRVRAGAEAARLDARAAELELLLRRMTSSNDVDQPMPAFVTQSAQRDLTEPTPTQQAEVPNRWSSRISRMQSRDNSFPPPSVNVFTSVQAKPVDLPVSHGSTADAHSHPNVDEVWQRQDPGSKPISAPHFSEREGIVIDRHDDASVADQPIVAEYSEVVTRKDSTPVLQPKPSIAFEATVPKPAVKSTDAATVVATLAGTALASKVKRPAIPLPAIKPINGEEESETRRRFRPASFLVSTLAHVVVLILLGIATLATKQPKDQLAFLSSATESSEETMETFAIESNEPMEDTEPIPTESAYEISTVGTIAVTEVSLDLPPAPAPPTTSDFLDSSSSSLSSSAMKSLKSDSKMKSQFCGVDGGGSHFVYLVDSSGSMKDGFQSARTELLASIDQLKPDQRFYVVFFDEEPAYMRISDPNADESASVMATPENKQRLRKWAMTVEMNKGKAPYEILPFALTLRPDVIFLLSDGEFPVKIEEILREQNRQENLFGESGPISIVHTIRYHGVEGETGRKAEETMVKIAKENGGQYRHVPKPK